MQEKFFTQLLHGISRDRLDSYKVGSNDDYINAFSRYLWNIALAEALLPALNAFEVALRNNIYDAFCITFGQQWLRTAGNFPFREKEESKIAGAKREISGTRKHLSRSPHRYVITDAQMVSQLSLGFWAALFNGHYHNDWLKVLDKKERKRNGILPYAPRSMLKSNVLRTRVEEIRKFRNQVFHHRAIWHRTDLSQRYTEALETIYWISPPMHIAIQSIDRFPDVYDHGSAHFKPVIEELLNN